MDIAEADLLVGADQRYEPRWGLGEDCKYTPSSVITITTIIEYRTICICEQHPTMVVLDYLLKTNLKDS